MRIRLPFFILLTACLAGCDLPPGEPGAAEQSTARSKAEVAFPLASDVATAARDRLPSSNIYLDLRDRAAMAGGSAKAVSLPTRHDINGDHRSDIGFVDTATGEFRYFAMDGARVIDDRRGYALPVGARVVSINDFDGDRRADVLWENGSEVRLSRARPDGNLHPSEFVMAYARGWRIPGTGDLNNDGTHDIVWFNPDTGEVHYLLMRGSEWIAQQGGYFVPRGFDLLAVEDILKDGHADLVLKKLQRVGGTAIHVVHNGSAPVSFGSPQPYATAAGLFAGSIDVNGDGTGDLVWHDPSNGIVEVATCAGAACMTRVEYLPDGYYLRQLGDFNGDGRGDALWSDGVALVLGFGNALGHFDAPAVLTGHTPGWDIAGDLAFLDRRRSTASHDVDGDFRSDLVWFDAATGSLNAFAVDGRYLGGTQVPVGFRILSVEDFDADGRSDVLWDNGRELRMSRARASGGFHAAEFMFARPTEDWQLANTADLNNDLTHDLAWFHRRTREVHYMLLAGPRVIAQRGGFITPFGTVAIGLSDKEGDGRADLIFSLFPEHSCGRGGTYVAHNRGDTFFDLTFDCRYNRVEGAVTTSPALPRTFEGIDDVDGDGRDDAITYREMAAGFNFPAGTATVSYASYATWKGTWSAVYDARLMGDYNGDGRADLMLSNEGDLLVAYARPGASGFDTPAFLAPDIPSMRLGAERSGSMSVDGDLNADRRSDLTWFDSRLGQLHFDLLDGARITARRGGFPLPSGMAPVGQADFNADGRSDMLLYAAGQGRLLLSTAAGTPVLSPVLFSAPSGWEVGGSVDLDFDGYADILLVNYALRQYHVFYMLGQVVAAQYGGPMSDFLPYGHDGADYRVRAIGNLFGNGDTQVAFQRITDGAVVIAGRRSSTGYADLSRRGFDRSHEQLQGFGGIVAGATDVNGDGQAELLIDGGDGRFGAYRFISSRDPWFYGFTRVGTYTLPAGFRIESLGDVDDDGDADVIASDGRQVAVSINGNGIWSPPVALADVLPGWTVVGTAGTPRP